MSRPLAILRPQPGWDISAAAAREAGLVVCGQPLFTIDPVAWQPPEGIFDALLVGSANVLRHGGEGLAALRDLPVHCVGEATADAAAEAGFTVAHVGSGGLQSILDAMAGRQRLLRLSGEERVSLRYPEGVSAQEVTVYRARDLPLDAAAIPPDAVVALHSGAAAARFAREVDRLALDRARLTLCAIGPRVAERAQSGWQSIHIAERPDDAALLALAGRLCQ